MVDMNRHFGVGDVLRSAIAALWSGRWPLAACLGVWVTLETGLRVLVSVYDPARFVLITVLDFPSSATHDPRLFDTSLAIERMIGTSSIWAVRAVFMVVASRIFLTGAKSIWSMGFPGFARAVLAILIFDLTWVALIGSADLLARALYQGVTGHLFVTGWSVPIPLAIFGFYAWILSRVCLVVPNCALGKGWRLVESWRLTRGNAMKVLAPMVLIFGLVLFAGALVYLLVLMVSIFFELPISDYDLPRSFVFGGGWATSAIDAIIAVLAVVTALAVFAVLYVRLTGFAAAGIAGFVPTPAQLTETFE